MSSTEVNKDCDETPQHKAYLATKKTATGLNRNKHILKTPQLKMTNPEAKSKISGARGEKVKLPSPR